MTTMMMIVSGLIRSGDQDQDHDGNNDSDDNLIRSRPGRVHEHECSGDGGNDDQGLNSEHDRLPLANNAGTCYTTCNIKTPKMTFQK